MEKRDRQIARGDREAAEAAFHQSEQIAANSGGTLHATRSCQTSVRKSGKTAETFE